MIWDNNEDIRLIQCTNASRPIQHALDECREERRPYVFVTNTMTIKPLRRILVPVTMLEEETYKAEICSSRARQARISFCFVRTTMAHTPSRTPIVSLPTSRVWPNEPVRRSPTKS